MFIRETEGVYKFGTRRVNVRVDKDKINIRVGGGYMTIDEFIDQFTPIEIAALERTDPMRQFGDKVEVSHTVSSRGRDDRSPPARETGRDDAPKVPISSPDKGIRT